jgi:hypothetical protein
MRNLNPQLDAMVVHWHAWEAGLAEPAFKMKTHTCRDPSSFC